MPLPLIAALAPHAGAAVPQLGGTNVEGPQRVVSSRSRFAKPENPFLDSLGHRPHRAAVPAPVVAATSAPVLAPVPAPIQTDAERRQ